MSVPQAESSGFGAIRVLLVGIGGYGGQYVRYLLDGNLEGVAVAAAVDPKAEIAHDLPRVLEAGIPVFDSLSAFFEEGIRVDLAVVSTPIALHADHTSLLLEAGVNVLCEKPMAGNLEGALRMKRARDASGKFLEIGYQWSFSDAIRSLKSDLLAGRFGAPLRISSWVAWPRPQAYYTRNNWAGRKWTEDHLPVFDSPANNATAHYLHNMLFLAGKSLPVSAELVSVTAECYRANTIENFDAVCCRIETREVPELLFYSAHCVDRHHDPVCRISLDHADVTLDPIRGIVARTDTGLTVAYGNPEANHLRKLEVCVEHLRSGGAVTEYCGPDAAMPHTACVAAMQETAIRTFPRDMVQHRPWEEESTLTYVDGLDEWMRQAYSENKLFSEIGFSWAQAAQNVEVCSDVW